MQVQGRSPIEYVALLSVCTQLSFFFKAFKSCDESWLFYSGIIFPTHYIQLSTRQFKFTPNWRSFSMVHMVKQTNYQ